MSIQCRTCAEKIYNPNAINIFEQDDNEILFNIETLTGTRLYEEKHLPKHICTCCHLELYHSIAFRERCIKTQNLLRNELIPFKASQKNVCSQKKPTNLPQATVTTKDNKLGTPDSPHSNSNTKQKNSNENRQKYSHDSITAEASSAIAPRQIPEALVRPDTSNAWPDNSIGHSEPIDELNSLSDLDELCDFQEEPHSQESPASTEPSKEQNDNNKKNTKNTPSKEDQSNKKKKPPANPLVYICDLCGQISQSRKNLQIHILRHKGEKNYECSECGLKHYSEYLLKLHVRVKHRGEMPFPCRYCGQRFYSGTTRTRHEKVRHIRNFSYECKICGKKYMTKSCLNKHEFLHTGLRPHKCDLCNVAFPRKPGLRIHCRTKQHQKRASEAMNNQLNGIKEITVSDDVIVLPDLIIQELDVQTAIGEVI